MSYGGPHRIKKGFIFADGKVDISLVEWQQTQTASIVPLSRKHRDQMGRFLKVLGNNFISKVAQIFGKLFGNFEKHQI